MIGQPGFCLHNMTSICRDGLTENIVGKVDDAPMITLVFCHE